jgi:hypothetical protein
LTVLQGKVTYRGFETTEWSERLHCAEGFDSLGSKQNQPQAIVAPSLMANAP